MKQALVPIRVEARWVLIEARLVREILGAQAWLPIPRARRELPGVIAWRGRAVPVVDLAVWFDARPLALREARARTLILDHDAALVALPIDAAREVMTVSNDALAPLHATDAPYATAELEVEGTPMPFVDLAALLDELGRSLDAGAGA